MNKYVVECIGTFFLVLTIGMTVIQPGLPEGFAPLAIGSALAVMICAGGHVSGGHFNPAVTLAVWIRGKCDTKDVFGYMAAQVGGATLAAFSVSFLKGNPTVTGKVVEVGPALFAEFLFTFALAWVVLHVATAKGTSGNSFYGLAIGFTVLTGAYAVGGVSGGAFNPAVAIGATILGMFQKANIWIYLAADFLGGAAAAIAFRAVVKEETPPAPPKA